MACVLLDIVCCGGIFLVLAAGGCVHNALCSCFRWFPPSFGQGGLKRSNLLHIIVTKNRQSKTLLDYEHQKRSFGETWTFV